MNDADDRDIDEYLKTIRSECKSIMSPLLFQLSFSAAPTADEEIALQTLFKHQMNTKLALANFRQLPVKTICKYQILVLTVVRNYVLDSYPAWSLDEIQKFEEGLNEFGKNFFKVSVFKVRIIFCEQ